MKTIYISLFVFLCTIMVLPQKVVQAKGSGAQPQLEKLEAVIETIEEERDIQPTGSQNWQLYQRLQLRITNGSQKNKVITIENGIFPASNIQKYKVGDRVVVSSARDSAGRKLFYISDYVRRTPILLLFTLFIILTIFIARWRGILSLLGMLFSFFILFYYLLPHILTGVNPVREAINGAIIIVPLTFYFSHGFNRKTSVAVVGTILSLIFTALLAHYFIQIANLTGFASEEASFLQVAKGGVIDMRGILLAGIIIGVLGVLDDITISQSAIVFQLKKANSSLQFSDLYTRAMDVGQDHISSMVNTLILVYTGASLPLFLLFINNPLPFSEIINNEMIADEIIRTLVGSIGLIISVPLTTFLASLIAHHDFIPQSLSKK